MKNEIPTNFIRHLLNVHEHFSTDQRLSPWHISLYYGLFHSWNIAKFSNPVTIHREELMKASKIGSANTYLKCLKDLDQWGYIKYLPSHNPFFGSKVHLYNIDITADTTGGITTNTTTDTTAVQQVRPFINSNKQYKETNERKGNEHKSESEESSLKKASPALQDVCSYFSEKGNTQIEAQKFFNYFESNGWLVGGKTPMKNWKAAANNWILNTKKFNAKPSDHLSTPHDKNYAEPL